MQQGETNEAEDERSSDVACGRSGSTPQGANPKRSDEGKRRQGHLKNDQTYKATEKAARQPDGERSQRKAEMVDR